MEKTPIHARVEPGVYAALTKMAKEREWSLSFLVCKILGKAVASGKDKKA